MNQICCKTCGITKPANGFYRGNRSRCKECVRESVKANRMAKIDHYRSFDKARASVPHRVAARAAYLATPRGVAAANRAKKAWRQRNADKRRAHSTLAKAVAKGTVRPLPCFVCGRDQAEAHHPDYSSPLAVTWLCSQHHAQLVTEGHVIAVMPLGDLGSEGEWIGGYEWRGKPAAVWVSEVRNG